MSDDFLIFGSSGSPKLTRTICEYLQVQPGAGEVLRFSEGNLREHQQPAPDVTLYVVSRPPNAFVFQSRAG